MVKGFFIDEYGCVKEIQDGRVIFDDGYDTSADYEDPWEYDEDYEDYFDLFDSDSPWEDDETNYEDFWEECEEIEPDDLILELLNFND